MNAPVALTPAELRMVIDWNCARRCEAAALNQTDEAWKYARRVDELLALLPPQPAPENHAHG